ncbi:MAG: VanW family protein [Lachnospiraceae bacterium]|nr:VanW family protein [Lachnospiraceae bacterium]
MNLMKYYKSLLLTAVSMLCVVFMVQKEALVISAKTEPVVAKGVYVEDMDLSGMTKAQARTTIENYVYKLLEDNTLLHLQFEDVAEHQPSGAVLGGQWTNTDMLDELMVLGNQGHVVDRYKSRKALEREPVNYEVEIGFSKEPIVSYIEKTFTPYNQEVRNYTLTRKENAFEIVEGAIGYEVDVERSAQDITDYLNKEWDRTKVFLPLSIAVVEPKGSVEELSQVKDLIGTFTSTFAGATSEKVTNISNGAKLIDGITMYPDEEFSFDAYAAPYTVANGYAMGKSYSGGKLVDDVGGGICQVSSTLYNAALRAELEITMRYNHSMIVGYVPISSDATLAETSGKDFRFKNNQEVPVYIESYITKDHKLVVNVYGKETRPAGRTVEYVSETLEVINPGPDVIRTDGTLPVGEVQVSSAYTGYKAKLWKVVKIDGVEKSRELVNTSNYRAVARMATVGMYTTDPAVLEKMNAAVATGNIDHVQNVVAAILAPPAESYE